MRFINSLPFVKDVERSKAFYCDLLLLRIVQDHGDFVQFVGGFAIHDGAGLHRTVFNEDQDDEQGPFGRKNLVLYFETNELDATFERLAPSVDVIHPIERQAWGQRVFRIHDPDGHIVEIGEPH